MSIETTIAALDAFEPSNDDSKNVYNLNLIFKDFRTLAGKERAVPAMFSLFERFLEAEFGSPGPLVHELEAIHGYQTFLIASLARQPTDPTVHMVNRILNSQLQTTERASWLHILGAAAEHPLAPEFVRESALHFIQYQAERSNA